MKKFLSLLLVFCTILSLVSCQSVDLSLTGESTATQTETQQKPSATTEETEPETYVPVPDPLTWDDINAIPIANSSMSVDQLRQICVDYMKLQVSFQWTPNTKFRYLIEHHNKYIDFEVGTVYGGHPYNAPNESGGGNLYNWMEYYDSETGVLDVKTAGALNMSKIITNHCSTSTFWAWARVVNTMSNFSNGTEKTGFANGRMMKQFGFLPIGPYNYDGYDNWYVQQEGTYAICQENGAQKIFESYAAMLPADGLVSVYTTADDKENHVQMASKKPIVVRNADGTINGDESYVIIMEQTSSPVSYTTEAGDTINIVGRVDVKFSFSHMYKMSYIPFTFAEFLGTDPVEAGSAEIEYTAGSEVTFDNLSTATLRTNYPIANYDLTITDATGAVVYSRNGFASQVNSFHIPMSSMIFARMKTHFKAGNQLKLDVRLSTGEVLTVINSPVAG